jgi:hypothetical protein
MIDRPAPQNSQQEFLPIAGPAGLFINNKIIKHIIMGSTTPIVDRMEGAWLQCQNLEGRKEELLKNLMQA